MKKINSGAEIELRGTADRAVKTAYDMLLLPDDLETCIDDLEKEIELMGSNEGCGPIYC